MLYNEIRNLFWRNIWAHRGKFEASVYSGGRFDRGIDYAEIEETYKNIVNKLRITSSDRMLDIGLSTALTEKLIDSVSFYAGVDYSFTIVKNIKEKVLGKKNTVLVAGVAESMPFEDNFFNKILCNSVFFYLFDDFKIQRVLNEIKRVSKKDALVLLGDIEFRNGKTPFSRAKTFYRKKKIQEPIKTLKILQETLLDSLGFRNRFTEEGLQRLIHPIGAELSISPHLQCLYDNKYDIVFKIVK